MADMRQNRSVSDLEEVITQFFNSALITHDIQLSYEAVGLAAQDALNDRINELLDERMESFSIPELMRIVALSATKISKTGQKTKEKKSPELQ